MLIHKILKLTGLNLGIAIVDIVLFSPGLLGIQIAGASTFAAAFAATAIFMSVVVFVFGNYKLFTENDKIIQVSEIKTAEDCIAAIKNCEKETFEKDTDTILEQTERFQKKKETIKDILLQKFNSTEMSYLKFDGTISDVEDVFYINIKSIINKLNAFDEEDYNHIRKDGAQKKFSKEFIQTKMSIYNEYISFVNNGIDDNEQIILKLDKILLEISNFNSLEDGEIENMSAIKEIDELINKTKLYR